MKYVNFALTIYNFNLQKKRKGDRDRESDREKKREIYREKIEKGSEKERERVKVKLSCYQEKWKNMGCDKGELGETNMGSLGKK